MFRTFSDVTRPPFVEKAASLDKPYECDLCPEDTEGWSSETEVELHRSNSHRNEIAEMMRCTDKPICKMCMKKFESTDALLSHIKEGHLLSSPNAKRVERDIFICSECGDIFFNKPMLTHHLNNHSPKSQVYKSKCPKCFKMICHATCWYHFQHHNLQSVSVCKICLTKCDDRKKLAVHLRSHLSVYKCEMCGYLSGKKDAFDSHIESVHKKPEVHIEAFDDKWKKYFVPHKEFKTWQKMSLMGWKGVRLTNHVRICVLCREICDGVDSMKRHIMVDHMSEEKVKPVVICTCGITFKSKVLYKHHLFKFKDEHMT